MKERKTKGSNWWGVLIFAVLILIDLGTKTLAELYLEGKSLPLIGNLVKLTLVYNRGISYGMGSNSPTALKIGVIIGTGVVMCVLAYLYFITNKNRSLLRTSFVFIVAGGIGNLIDRVYYKVWITDGAQGVRDMVDVSKFGFAVCNFADFFITAGAIMLVLSFLFFDKDAIFPVGKYKQLAKENEK